MSYSHYTHIIHAAVVSGVSADINSPEPVNFLAGDESGAISCVSISITDDMFLEISEIYELSLFSEEENIVEIENGVLNITIIDNDSKFIIMLLKELDHTNIHVANDSLIK